MFFFLIFFNHMNDFFLAFFNNVGHFFEFLTHLESWGRNCVSRTPKKSKKYPPQITVKIHYTNVLLFLGLSMFEGS